MCFPKMSGGSKAVRRVSDDKSNADDNNDDNPYHFLGYCGHIPHLRASVTCYPATQPWWWRRRWWWRWWWRWWPMSFISARLDFERCLRQIWSDSFSVSVRIWAITLRSIYPSESNLGPETGICNDKNDHKMADDHKFVMTIWFSQSTHNFTIFPASNKAISLTRTSSRSLRAIFPLLREAFLCQNVHAILLNYYPLLWKYSSR